MSSKGAFFYNCFYLLHFDRGLDTPFKFILDGFDDFEKIQTIIHDNNTLDFELFFPFIDFQLAYETDDGLILAQGAQMSKSNIIPLYTTGNYLLKLFFKVLSGHKLYFTRVLR